MKRDIKFRAWDKEDEKMCIVGALDWDCNIKVISCNTLDKKLYMCDPDDFILMQYTGLKDKNGVEIYEGDIVKLKSNTYEVYWLDCEYRLSPHDCRNEYDKGKMIRFAKVGEVIGNIYENPELLNNN